MSRHALLALIFGLLLPSPLRGQEANMVRLIDFGTELTDEWFVVNDGVMGGRSSSRLRAGEAGVAVFEGYLSLENNGGFASVRTAVPEGVMADASRIYLRVRGDGKRYQLRLRPGRRWDGVAFGASFETTAGQWITVELPLSAFEPSFRGYRPRGVGPLDGSQVGQIGLMLTDGQEGPFRLEVEWISMDGADTL